MHEDKMHDFLTKCYVVVPFFIIILRQYFDVKYTIVFEGDFKVKGAIDTEQV